MEIIPNDTELGNTQLYQTKVIDDATYEVFPISSNRSRERIRIIWRKQKAPQGSTRKTDREPLAFLKTWTYEGILGKNVRRWKSIKGLIQSLP